MITYQQARTLIGNNVSALPSELIVLQNIDGHVLSQNIVAGHDMPMFDNAAVDGYGVLTHDIESADTKPAVLTVIGTSQAGHSPGDIRLAAGKALRIMTGAMVPPTVEAVIMQEDVKQVGHSLHVHRSVPLGAGIRRRGEEYRAGDTIIRAGTRMTPPVIGMLASLGVERAHCHRLPQATILVTGDELVQPGGTLGDAEIYESNSFALRAALRRIGIVATVVHVRDERRALTRVCENALCRDDLLITVGGVSVGEYDYVKTVLADLGVEQVYWKIAMKPGKPNYFGIQSQGDTQRYVFGLPGNPVSAMVSFFQLVKPAIGLMMGLGGQADNIVQATLTADVSNPGQRLSFVRGVASNQEGRWLVRPTSGQGSHMIGGLIYANCLIHCHANQDHFSAGDCVSVSMLEW